MKLSKSLYTRAIQCPKSLWLKKYTPELLTPPDASAQARFETGNMVGDLACELFPGGKEVAFKPESFEAMAEQTRAWIAEGLPYIYEATFIFDGIVVMVDVLHVRRDSIVVYEVKSSTEVKEIYLHDVSIQRYVLEQLGFHVGDCYVVHIDNTYVRGEALDISALFKVVHVNSEVDALMPDIPENLNRFKKVLQNREQEPNVDIGKHCMKPYECDAKAYCWQVQRRIPEYSIFNIFNLGSAKQQELYAQGIVDIGDIPEDFQMTAAQQKKVEVYQSNSTHIDTKAIGAFLNTLGYPLYHLDFETFSQAIPEYAHLRPFEQIPFQYSLHVEHQDGTLEHFEFLAKAGADPRRALAERLVADIPLHVTVLAYNMSFEKGVIKKLAEQFDDLHVSLMAIHENIKDLMLPFQKGYYVTPDMQGSYSIKKVLPALVPEMEQAYKELDGIHNGGEAMNAFASLHVKPIEEQETLRTQLLAYCKLDTLAMVRVLGKLKEITDNTR